MGNACSSFSRLHLPDTLCRALLLAGYRRPSPVQEAAIPLAKLGTDIVVRAKSGTGKTLVFALSCLESVNASLPAPQALVLSPTREIAQQNAAEIRKIANNLPNPNLSCGVFTGGVPVSDDQRRLRRPCQIVVATPGRLCCLVHKGEINLQSIRLLVLDEADQLFSGSLRDSVEVLFSCLPEAKQSLALSATYTDEILTEIENQMDAPQRVFIDESEKGLIGVKQCYKIVDDDQSKIQALLEIFKSASFHQAVVFCNCRRKAERITHELSEAGYSTAFTSGHKSQEHRNSTMKAMRMFELRVVVSTDLIARGVDLERVNLVCNLDLPFNQETYQHRVGRTGRFGTHGISVSLVTQSEKPLLESYALEGCELVELPTDIPTEWYNDSLITYNRPVEVQTPPEAMKRIPTPTSNWIGNIPRSEFLSWKEKIDKKNLFWNHWDPYGSSVSRSSSRDGMPRLTTTSDVSLETGSTRKTNCIHLPSRLSRSTSNSSIVYSEEGDVEFLESWMDVPSEISSPLPPPTLPPVINSESDFNTVKEEYEKWRKEYSKWHEQYSEWFSSVQTSPAPSRHNNHP